MQVERLISHRGASAYAPENTLVAFDKALAMGCRFIEFDVMLSADGEAFIFHDETLQRTTNGRGAFGLTTSAVLKSLDAGRWFSKQYQGVRIPTLREALDWLIASEVQANIEIKPYPGQTEETAVAVLTHLNRYWPQERPWPLLSSFEVEVLDLCHNISPEMPLGLLLDQWQEHWLEQARRLNCYSVHLNKRVLTKSRVEEIKQYDYKVYAYTVNRRRQAEKLLNWGVDAVFSDYPDLLT
ncbi:glycerophosphodiester phosphodiesterase [Legionella nagasakiensis]|uniref:glycerophosphodiester phosphodiesterase n=1 Tax=Legionella nagasakiensis TaxID=535290 RepID=UPI001A9475E6|nr:glycerophosphodiester phosphodiesterase [Legionella nagasakiensis]